jgi:hypothetical protein
MMGNGLRKSVLAVSVGLAVILTSVCDEDKSPTSASSAPATLKYISGNNQAGLRLNRLAQPLVVQVLDYDDDPVAAHKVVFEVTSLTGTLAGSGQKKQEVVTNANGMTSVYLVLGDSLGLDSVRASAVDASNRSLNGSPILFTAEAVEGSPGGGVPGGDGTTPGDDSQDVQLSLAVPDRESNIVGDTLSLQVTVSTSAGLPVSGQRVKFEVKQGGWFHLDENTDQKTAEDFTDNYGKAAVDLVVDTLVGTNTVEITTLGALQPLSYVTFGVAAPEQRISKIESEHPDSIAAFTNSPLPTQQVVRVMDSYGNPVSQVSVYWNVLVGDGTVDNSSTETDPNGLAYAIWTMGPAPGENSLQAHFIDQEGNIHKVSWAVSAQSTEISLAGPDSIALISGDDQTGEVAAILPLSLVVQVFNEDRKPVSGAEVTFTVTRGFGNISLIGSFPVDEMLTVTTDDQGVAAVTLKLGPGPDLDNEVVAQIRRPDGTADSVVFRAVARPKSDTANSLVIMSGNYQGLEGNYIVGTEMPLPLVVGVFDAQRSDVDPPGVPIPNFPVLFEAFSPSGDATVDDVEGVEPAGTGRLEALTDEDGLAAVRLTMGTKTGTPDDLTYLRNNNHVVAVAVFADGTQDSVIFFATAVPAAPSSIAAAGGTDLSGIAGKPLSGLTVVVADQYGNSNAGVPVGFVIDRSPGGGSISQPLVLTDISGYAASGLSQLSTRVGEMKVSAVNGTLGGSPVTFTITVSADEADVMMVAGGDSQAGTVGSAFSIPLKVMILDQYGNPKPGDLVTFTVTAGSASLSDVVKATGADGLAQTTVTPLSTAVTITAGAVIHGATQTVTFNLTATAEE